MSDDPIKAELVRLIDVSHRALDLLSKAERMARRIGLHHPEDQHLMASVRALLLAEGWRIPSGLHAPISPAWASDPPPWRR